MQVFFQTLVGGLSLGAIYALVALGFSLVYRTMGLVNFAHADVVMIGAYVASTFYMSAKLPFVLAILVAIVSTGLIGVFMERVLRPLENKDFDLMLIGTIGFGIMLEARSRPASHGHGGSDTHTSPPSSAVATSSDDGLSMTATATAGAAVAAPAIGI